MKNRIYGWLAGASVYFIIAVSHAYTANLNNGLVWGTNSHPTYGSGPYAKMAVDTQMYQMQQAGLKIYRMSIESIDGITDQKLMDAVNAGNRYGIQVLPVIINIGKDQYANAYLNGSVVTDFRSAYSTAYNQAYSFGSYYGRKFGGSIPVWEVGNEYDAIALQGGPDGASYSHYSPAKFWLVRESLRGMIDGLKSANGSLKVMVDFLWCHTGFMDMLWTGATPDYPYANAFAPIRWDITGLHWYYGMSDGNPTAAACWAGKTDILKKAKLSYGKPIWITEFGDDKGAENGDKPTMTSHTEGMMELFKTVASKYNVQAALSYELYDQPDKQGREAHFGMCDSNGNCNTQLYNMVKWFTGTKQYQLAWQSPIYINNGQCVDVAGASKDNNARIDQYSCVSGAGNQQWQLVPYGNAYQIRSAHSWRCLEVPGGATNNGAAVDQWDCGGASHQLWYVIPQWDGSSNIINAKSGRCLDVPGANYNNRSPAYLEIYDCNGGGNQKFWMNF